MVDPEFWFGILLVRDVGVDEAHFLGAEVGGDGVGEFAGWGSGGDKRERFGWTVAAEGDVRYPFLAGGEGDDVHDVDPVILSGRPARIDSLGDARVG